MLCATAVKGQHWKPDLPTVFTIRAIPSIHDGTVNVRLELAFTHVSLPKGILRKTKCHFACRGARIDCFSEELQIQRYTQGTKLTTSVQLEEKVTSGVNWNASVGLKGKQPEAGMGLVTTAGSEVKSQAQFSSVPFHVSATKLSDGAVRWTVLLPRGAQPVSEFLEGNVTLVSDFAPVGGRQISARVTAIPRDIRLFDDDNHPLSRLATLAMRIRLWKDGTAVPSNEAIEIRIAQEEHNGE